MPGAAAAPAPLFGTLLWLVIIGLVIWFAVRLFRAAGVLQRLANRRARFDGPLVPVPRRRRGGSAGAT